MSGLRIRYWTSDDRRVRHNFHDPLKGDVQPEPIGVDNGAEIVVPLAWWTPPIGVYRPCVFGATRLHFVDAKAGVDTWESASLVAPLAEEGALWAEATRGGELRLGKQGLEGASYSPLPAGAARPQSPASWRRSLEEHIHQNVTLDLLQCPGLKLTARPGEAEGDFTARVAHTLREKRDAEVEELRKKYAVKMTSLQDQVARARERVDREQSQYGQQKWSTAVSIGASILGALLGRKTISSANVGRAASAMRGAGRIGREKEDVARASERAGVLDERMKALEAELDAEVGALTESLDPARVPVERTQVRPRKSDISVGAVSLLWTPWRVAPDGTLEPAS